MYVCMYVCMYTYVYTKCTCLLFRVQEYVMKDQMKLERELKVHRVTWGSEFRVQRT